MPRIKVDVNLFRLRGIYTAFLEFFSAAAMAGFIPGSLSEGVFVSHEFENLSVSKSQWRISLLVKMLD